MIRIEKLRKEIDALNHQIVQLFSRRLSCSKEIAQIKKREGIPFFDQERESYQLHYVRRIAESEGLDPDVLGAIFSRFVIYSRQEMERCGEVLQPLETLQKRSFSCCEASPLSEKRFFIPPSTQVVFGDIRRLLQEILPSKEIRYVIITDDQVRAIYGETLQEELLRQGYSVSLFSFPGGEESKTRETKYRLENALLEEQCGTETILLALGGGVVTDLAGFVAATYGRGIPLISIPTTLLAMVDASIGGKTGVNVPQGKNWIGAFHPASFVVVDLSWLRSLPQKEWRNGWAEIIKYGLIASPKIFSSLEEGVEGQSLEEIIFACIAIKRDIVSTDPSDKGIRRSLHFGHAIGHAIETLLQFTISHGEAVALGLLFESYVSWKLGSLSQTDWERIPRLLEKFGFALRLPREISFTALQEALSRDKKAHHGTSRMVVLDGIGAVRSFGGEYCTFVPSKLLEEAYEQFSN